MAPLFDIDAIWKNVTKERNNLHWPLCLILKPVNSSSEKGCKIRMSKKWLTRLGDFCYKLAETRPPLRREEYDRRYQIRLRDWLLYHQKEIVFDRASWMGLRIWKNPLDAWIYQEILYEVKPDLVVEIGSRYGGSTQYFANLLDIMDHGQVLSIDTERSEYECKHPRVTALTGDSADPAILSQVDDFCRDRRVFVIHDADHSQAKVAEDLRNYSRYVSLNSYFVVEDGIVDLFHEGDGLGFREGGPLAATEAFLAQNPNFIADTSRERYLLTYNPKGFLKRIA